MDFNSQFEVAIPEETQYRQINDKTSKDYLCAVYSNGTIYNAQIKNVLADNPQKSFVKIAR